MNIHLYHRWDSENSALVRDFIIKNDLSFRIHFHEINEERSSLKALRELNGSDDVPCLVVDGKMIADAPKILLWLKYNLMRDSALLGHT